MYRNGPFFVILLFAGNLGPGYAHVRTPCRLTTLKAKVFTRFQMATHKDRLKSWLSEGETQTLFKYRDSSPHVHTVSPGMYL